MRGTIIDNEFDLGQIVYLKTDGDQSPRIITKFFIYPGGNMMYELSCGITASPHYGCEINAERSVVTATA